MTGPEVIPNGDCTCPICRVEQELVLTLNERASQRRFRKLAAGRRALATFSSASELIARLHDRHQNGDRPRSADQILGALIRARPSNGNHNLWQSVLVLAFVPTLHKTYCDVCVQFPGLLPEDIAQQALTAFLELAQSPSLACRRRYLSVALACGLRKTVFRWAIREAEKSGGADPANEAASDFREPVADGHFESSVLLDDFLSHCRQEGILPTSDYQLLVEMKVQGYRAKEVTELAGRISASGIYQRLRRALLGLRGRALAKGRCRSTWSPGRANHKRF
jgi:hypothetical protein